MDVLAAQNFNMALRADGTVFCWGEEALGMCAYGGGAGVVDSATQSPNLACMSQVSLVPGLVAGLDGNANVKVWGVDKAEVFLTDTELVTTVPTSMLHASRLTVGSKFLVIETEEGAHYWAGKMVYEFGLGAQKIERTDFAELSALGKSRDTAASGHACFLLESGDLYCWGGNSKGGLGVPGIPYAEKPVRVEAAESLLQVEADFQLTCALGSSGSVYCTGDNGTGQLGYPEPAGGVGFVEALQLVQGVPPADGLWAGDGQVCARARTGGLWCWGEELEVPTPVPTPVDPVDVAIGMDSFCVLDAIGDVYCTGTLPTYLGRCGGDDESWGKIDFKLECPYP